MIPIQRGERGLVKPALPIDDPFGDIPLRAVYHPSNPILELREGGKLGVQKKKVLKPSF